LIARLNQTEGDCDDLPIPDFDHNWSEYPDTEAADLVPRLFWAITAITHACPIDADRISQLHKLTRVVVTGPAVVDVAACEARDYGAAFACEQLAGPRIDRSARSAGRRRLTVSPPPRYVATVLL
jgi:hypothetical protein